MTAEDISHAPGVLVAQVDAPSVTDARPLEAARELAALVRRKNTTTLGGRAQGRTHAHAGRMSVRRPRSGTARLQGVPRVRAVALPRTAAPAARS
jgi:hypothetical protein